jgi:hypothetical protein
MLLHYLYTFIPCYDIPFDDIPFYDLYTSITNHSGIILSLNFIPGEQILSADMHIFMFNKKHTLAELRIYPNGHYLFIYDLKALRKDINSLNEEVIMVSEQIIARSEELSVKFLGMSKR